MKILYNDIPTRGARKNTSKSSANVAANQASTISSLYL